MSCLSDRQLDRDNRDKVRCSATETLLVAFVGAIIRSQGTGAALALAMAYRAPENRNVANLVRGVWWLIGNLAIAPRRHYMPVPRSPPVPSAEFVRCVAGCVQLALFGAVNRRPVWRTPRPGSGRVARPTAACLMRFTSSRDRSASHRIAPGRRRSRIWSAVPRAPRRNRIRCGA